MMQRHVVGTCAMLGALVLAVACVELGRPAADRPPAARAVAASSPAGIRHDVPAARPAHRANCPHLVPPNARVDNAFSTGANAQNVVTMLVGAGPACVVTNPPVQRLPARAGVDVHGRNAIAWLQFYAPVASCTVQSYGRRDGQAMTRVQRMLLSLVWGLLSCKVTGSSKISICGSGSVLTDGASVFGASCDPSFTVSVDEGFLHVLLPDGKSYLVRAVAGITCSEESCTAAPPAFTAQQLDVIFPAEIASVAARSAPPTSTTTPPTTTSTTTTAPLG